MDKSYEILLQNKIIKIIMAENILIHEVKKKIQDRSDKHIDEQNKMTKIIIN